MATGESNLTRALEVFVAIAETGQVTQAARLLGMTQSAASQHLRHLEDRFGARLVDRSIRPARLTQAGVLAHRHALRILNAVEDLASAMRHEGPRPISRLRVGMLASVATTLTPDLVTLAKESFDVQDMTLLAGQSGDHEALLRGKKADIVVTSNPLYDMDGLERHAVLRESFLLVLPGSYDGPVRSLQEILAQLPMIRFGASTSVGRRTEQHLRRVRITPPRVIQADRSSMVTACVARGMGCTFLTPSLLIDGFVEGMALNIRPLPVAGFSREITVLARAGDLGALPRRLAETARAALIRQITRQMGAVGRAALSLPDDG